MRADTVKKIESNSFIESIPDRFITRIKSQNFNRDSQKSWNRPIVLTKNESITIDLPKTKPPQSRLVCDNNFASFKMKKVAYRHSFIKLGLEKVIQERIEPLEERYIFKKTLGRGGFGVVKMVQDKVTNQLLAVKIIPKENINITNTQTIDNEIKVLKKLDHPNIIKLHEFAQDKENFYLITELCTGGELFDRVSQMKGFNELTAARIMKSILSAIAYCHDMNIVHRDLKPENLLFNCLGEDTVIKIIDFGTSTIFNENMKLSQAFGTV